MEQITESLKSVLQFYEFPQIEDDSIYTNQKRVKIYQLLEELSEKKLTRVNACSSDTGFEYFTRHSQQ